MAKMNLVEFFHFRALIVLTPFVVVITTAFVPMAQSAPTSGGTVSQSGNCPAGRQANGHCLQGGPGIPARPSGPIHPPVTPPVIPQIVPPSGRPQATRPQDPELPLYVIGSAKATFHIHDADRDIIYTSDEVPLTFMRRIDQSINKNTEGNTQYILIPNRFNIPPGPQEEILEKTLVIWMAEGREFDCTVKGKAIVTLPARPGGLYAPGGGMYLDPTDDTMTTQPAYGYLNVVGPDGGDFHSVMIKAFNHDARLIKTCPGDPPLVTEEKFDAGFLLHILSQKNTYTEDGRVIFQGHQEYDQGNLLDFLNLLPPGAAIPEDARRALQASGSGTSLRYTWMWKLIPVPPSSTR